MLDRTFIDEYEKGAAKTASAIAGLSREELFALPIPGTWSIQQIVHHLADTEQVFADRIKRVIAEENATLLAFDENRWMSALHYSEQSAQDAATLIELTRRQLSCVFKKLPDDAFDRTGAHSELGPWTLRFVIGRANDHLEHHLKFLLAKRDMVGVRPLPKLMLAAAPR